MNRALREAIAAYQLPGGTSHKGQNGKLLIIGGSDLFHAASKWSLDVASHIVDMVFYSSVVRNNELVQLAKSEFWNGIVVPRSEVENYIVEADCVLIGPGMERRQGGAQTSSNSQPTPLPDWRTPLSQEEWENDTERITNYLLATYSDKKWVIDAGALQMVDPQLLNERCIITPHLRELTMVLERSTSKASTQNSAQATVHDHLQSLAEFATELSNVHDPQIPANIQLLKNFAVALNNPTIVLKGALDFVGSSEYAEVIAGGNPGMTKGGTGDVLAGLIAALYCTTDAKNAALLGSHVNKVAGEKLAQAVGPFFNTSELAKQVPESLWSTLSSSAEV
jgi:NAD(P)H-hydrate epimerase